LHVPCNSFASLFVVRFFLGVAEACIVPAFLLTLSMFFTYDEQAVLMPCMWAVGNSSPITSGLLSYGVLWINTGSFSPWKWFMGMLVAFHFTSSNIVLKQPRQLSRAFLQ
jgi:MFS family permease